MKLKKYIRQFALFSYINIKHFFGVSIASEPKKLLIEREHEILPMNYGFLSAIFELTCETLAFFF